MELGFDLAIFFGIYGFLIMQSLKTSFSDNAKQYFIKIHIFLPVNQNRFIEIMRN